MNPADPNIAPADNIAIWIAVIAFLGTIVSSLMSYRASKKANRIAQEALKKNSHLRLAEFRKEWIESLRGQVALFLSKDIDVVNCAKQMDELSGVVGDQNIAKELRENARSRNFEIMHQYQRAFTERQAALGTILLLMNDEENANGELCAALDKVMTCERQTETWAIARNKTIDAARIVFKNEWLRATNEILSTQEN